MFMAEFIKVGNASVYMFVRIQDLVPLRSVSMRTEISSNPVPITSLCHSDQKEAPIRDQYLGHVISIDQSEEAEKRSECHHGSFGI